MDIPLVCQAAVLLCAPKVMNVDLWPPVKKESVLHTVAMTETVLLGELP